MNRGAVRGISIRRSVGSRPSCASRPVLEHCSVHLEAVDNTHATGATVVVAHITKSETAGLEICGSWR